MFRPMFLLGFEADCTVRNDLSFPHIHNELRNCWAVGKLASLPLTVSDTTWLTQKPCSGPESLTPQLPCTQKSPKALATAKKRKKKTPRNTPNPCLTPLPLGTKPIAGTHKEGEAGQRRGQVTLNKALSCRFQNRTVFY